MTDLYSEVEPENWPTDNQLEATSLALAELAKDPHKQPSTSFLEQTRRYIEFARVGLSYMKADQEGICDECDGLGYLHGEGQETCHVCGGSGCFKTK